MSYLYVVGPHDPDMTLPAPPIKIGVASNPRARLKGLQTGCPDKLTFYAIWRFQNPREAAEMERACHRNFLRFRRLGEWFNTSCDDVRDFVHGRMNLNSKPTVCLYGPHH